MKIITKIVAGLVLAAFAMFVPSVANAEATCVPQDAWTETIEHPAVGTPTVTVDNPDYVPATDGHYTTEPNPDYVPATPDTTVVTGYMKWNWTGGKKKQPVGPPPGEGWHQVGVTSDSKGNTPDTVLHQGNGNGSWFYFQTITEVVPGKPAQGEPTIQVWHGGTPAVGTPTIEVTNPDYKAAWTEKIEHPAVTCPVDPQPITPPTFTDETCDAWPSYTIPDVEGVRYFNGQYLLKSGTYEMQTRYRHLTLSATDMEGNFLGSWNHVYTPPVGCEFPILWSFESGTDFTCESFSYWHDIAYNTRIENAKSYEYKIEGAVNKTGTYTEPGSFSFDAPAGSKSYLTVWAVFDTYKLPIIERVFNLPKCDTPPTTSTDGSSNAGGSNTESNGSSDAQGTSGTGADGQHEQKPAPAPKQERKVADELAVTGGSDTTMYIVTAGVALAVLGALVTGFAIMKRREDKDD